MKGWNRDAIEAWDALSEEEKRVIAGRWAKVSGASRFAVEDYALACKLLQEAAARRQTGGLTH